MRSIMSKKIANTYKKFVRNFSYMGGVDRETTRIKESAEVFTPTPIVEEILGCYPPEVFSENQEFVDIACGDGQFLTEIIVKKLEGGVSLEDALKNTYGSDIMVDNIQKCRQRLAGPNPSEKITKILEKTIICADSMNPSDKGWKDVGYMWKGKSHADDFFDFS